MCELLIHNIVKEIEAWDMKQFTSYPFTTNTEVNLPASLMISELLIHKIIKENEAQAMKHFTGYRLTS